MRGVRNLITKGGKKRKALPSPGSRAAIAGGALLSASLVALHVVALPSSSSAAPHLVAKPAASRPPSSAAVAAPSPPASKTPVPDAANAPQEASPVIQALRKEMKRSLEKMRNAGAAPVYFLSYRVMENDAIEITAKYGALQDVQKPERSRFAQIELRVGSPQLDNSHNINEDTGGNFFVESVRLPIENDEEAIRSALWRGTDKAFKAAQKRYALVRSKRDLRAKETDQSNDFSMERKETYIKPIPEYVDHTEEFRQEAKRLSSIFNEYPFMRESSVKMTYGRETHYLVNSEGTEIQDSLRSYLVQIYGDTVVDDGMELWLFERIEAFGSERLPSEKELEKTIRTLANRLKALRAAPIAEPYAGPAILRGRAAGVFFHEILGHRLEGHRQKEENEGRTFKDKVGKQIMPRFISVIDDPSIEKINGKELSGFYNFDDEGVRARPVVLVDKGVLKCFLMSRSPIAGFSKSNGHGRCDYNHNPVARQGNLTVNADKKHQVSEDALRRMLIEETKRQKKSYGLIFEDLEGGSTLTHIGEPQLFNLYPLLVKKVYTDGRPDEWVRGADIVGTPLASLELIMAASDKPASFNGVCGAESGWVPVSATSPSLLVKSIEVQRKQKSDEKPPFLPAPIFAKPKASSSRAGASVSPDGGSHGKK